MQYFTALELLSKRFPAIDYEIIRAAFDAEVKEIEADLKGRQGKQSKYAVAVEAAHDNISLYLSKPDNFANNVSFSHPASIVSFLATHRPGCALAVLAALADKLASREPPDPAEENRRIVAFGHSEIKAE